MGVYAVLVPLMVFFTLKDKDQLQAWAQRFIPKRSELSFRVWREVDQKIANYIRGKFVEIVIVWSAAFVVFVWAGLDYSLLLSLLVGISVIIPYIGAVAVTVPIAVIAYFQWGLTARESAPISDHSGGSVFRRLVRGLGRFLRHSSGHSGPNRSEGLAAIRQPEKDGHRG